MKRVFVHIDAVTLKGFRHEDRYAIAQGIEQELGRVLSAPGSVDALSALDGASRIAVQDTRIAPGSKPSGVGAQVARGIGREISG